MEKRGQITIFVIIGLLILVVVGAFLFLSGKFSLSELESEEEITELNSVRSYLEGCVGRTAEEGVYLLGKQGGYYAVENLFTDYPVYAVPEYFGFEEKTNLLNENILQTSGYDIANGENFDFGALSYSGFKSLFRSFDKYAVPYYFYLGNETFPEKDVLEKELAIYIEDNLEYCVDFSNFKGLEIEGGEEVKVKTTITSGSVLVDLKYPLEIKKGKSKINLDSFKTSISSELGDIYEIVKEFVEVQKEDTKSVPLGFLTNLAEKEKMEFVTVNIDDSDILYRFLLNKDEDKEYVYTFMIRYDWSDLDEFEEREEQTEEEFDFSEGELAFYEEELVLNLFPDAGEEIVVDEFEVDWSNYDSITSDQLKSIYGDDVGLFMQEIEVDSLSNNDVRKFLLEQMEGENAEEVLINLNDNRRDVLKRLGETYFVDFDSLQGRGNLARVELSANGELFALTTKGDDATRVEMSVIDRRTKSGQTMAKVLPSGVVDLNGVQIGSCSISLDEKDETTVDSLLIDSLDSKPFGNVPLVVVTRGMEGVIRIETAEGVSELDVYMPPPEERLGYSAADKGLTGYENYYGVTGLDSLELIFQDDQFQVRSDVFELEMDVYDPDVVPISSHTSRNQRRLFLVTNQEGEGGATISPSHISFNGGSRVRTSSYVESDQETTVFEDSRVFRFSEETDLYWSRYKGDSGCSEGSNCVEDFTDKDQCARMDDFACTGEMMNIYVSKTNHLDIDVLDNVVDLNLFGVQQEGSQVAIRRNGAKITFQGEVDKPFSFQGNPRELDFKIESLLPMKEGEIQHKVVMEPVRGKEGEIENVGFKVIKCSYCVSPGVVLSEAAYYHGEEVDSQELVGDRLDGFLASVTVQRARAALMEHPIMADPKLSNIGAPVEAPIKNKQEMRAREIYGRVIDQFDVQNSHGTRYGRGAGMYTSTKCNYFALDVMEQMFDRDNPAEWGQRLPRMTDDSAGTVDAEYYLEVESWDGNIPNYVNRWGGEVQVMNANRLHDWLGSSVGQSKGWRQIDFIEAQERANQGHPTVGVWRAPGADVEGEGSSGHIVVVRPGEDSVSSVGRVRISDAGRTNHNDAPLLRGFGQDKIGQVKFFTHN